MTIADGATATAATTITENASKLDHAIWLASLGFWVFPCRHNGKLPAVKGWQQWATRDPEKIAAMWGQRPDDYNIGIFTEKFGDDAALIVVDVDRKKGNEDGERTLLGLEILGEDLPRTFRVNTASGGYHLFFTSREAKRQGTKVLGPGVDIRSRGGYVVGAGSIVGTGQYCPHYQDHPPLAEAPGWLAERLTNRSRKRGSENPPAKLGHVDPDRAQQRAIRYLDFEAPSGVEGSRNDTGYRVAARLKDLGVERQEAVALMGARWVCVPPLDQGELERTVDSAYTYTRDAIGSDAPEAVFTPVAPAPAGEPGAIHPFERLNQEFAFTNAGGGGHILWETKDENDAAKLVHLNLGAFHQRFAAHTLQVGRSNIKITEGWMEWKQRRSYDDFVFMPEQQAPERFYNLWKGFAYAPLQRSETSPRGVAAVDAFLDHVHSNVCRNDSALSRWLIGYFAHMVQRPWEKPLVALVFKGGKGVGKNAPLERIGALLGQHFLLASNRRYLVSNFNGHLENCLFFVLDEAFWSGDKQAEGTLKDLITGTHHIIEHKGEKPYRVHNRTRVAIVGNEEWLVPASHDERRFAVFDVGSARQGDRPFFIEMRAGMEAGGYGLLLQHLQNTPLSDVNGAPVTEALLQQKHATLEPLQQWWLECLYQGQIVGSDFGGQWPADIECERMRSAFRRYARDRSVRSRLPTDSEFGKQLLPWMGHHRIRLDDAPTWVYRVKNLPDSRKVWDQFIGQPVKWPT